MPLRGNSVIFVTLAPDKLTECDQAGKNPLKYSTMAGGIDPEQRERQTVGFIHMIYSPCNLNVAFAHMIVIDCGFVDHACKKSHEY